MLKPFNAESTKLGDPVVAKRFQRSTIEQARYLAKLEDGRHVVEFQAVTGSSFVEVLDEDSLFIAPKKRTVYVNIWAGEVPRGSIYSEAGLAPDGAHSAYWFETAELAEAAAKNGSGGPSPFVRAIAVPIEIEE